MRPQTVVERLDFIAKRIPGLKFTPPTQLKPGDDQGYGCFMSCDMYYIEIKVDQSHQIVKDVVISHGNNAEGISCPVLRKVLSDQDFEIFAKHLSGLHSIYQINTNDKKVKQRAYPALTALETDLATLYDHQRRRTNNCHDLVHKSPIGIMEPRKGGLPVRLTYFITPYDLVDTTQKGLTNLTINNIIDKNLGLSATVEIEGSSLHKLQVRSLISNQQNSSLPAYAPFNSQNSEKLPAQFVLKLSQPFPMLNTSIHQIIAEINEPATIKDYLTTITANSKESLVSLIARQELDLNKGPFCRSVDVLKGSDSDTCDLRKHVYTIKLLDQYHTYHILDNYLKRPDGVYVSRIPFTHPTSIPNILRVLRQQALFNFVIGSCIRRNRNNNNNNFDESLYKISQETNIFDVIPVNLSNICISFEHPSKESIATLEIDFKELSCHLYALDKESVCSNEFATKVLQKCWSIPITLRSVLKKCDERRLALLDDANKRRERELQELLTNTTSAQSGIQYQSHLQYQETLLQSKFCNLNEKSSSRDLNSIAEFLTSKINNASTSDASNQTNSNTENANNRSNLLKKFSCKPKAKQSTMTKNQTGNKILSLMLKRQNSSSSSADDASLKATLIKKVKTKNSQGESSSKNSPAPLTTTKLISTEAANAARLANRQAKQGNGNQNVSLIRSPNKSQQTSAISSSSNSPLSIRSCLTSQDAPSSSKQFDSQSIGTNNTNATGVRLKTLSNGSNNALKPRKSSIGAVLDRLVGGLTPEQSLSSNPGSSNDSNPESITKSVESVKDGSSGSKSSKSRTPSDQFAIKQGSLGSLKLTVTKTKLNSALSSTPTSNSSSPLANTTTANSSTSLAASPLSSTISVVGISSNNKSDTNKILGLGSSAPSIKYTIPKISKTQQASQANPSQTSSTDQNSTTNDSNLPSDDSGNPSSSAANSSLAPSSTTSKRTTSTPFSRSNSANRNPVSSSTHPLGRTTSNPLANAISRPSSTNASDAHLLNRISSSNQGQQSLRQQIGNRIVNLQQQPIQRTMNPNFAPTQQQLANPQSNPAPMFAIGLPQQSNSFLSSNDLNILGANQAALLSQQQQQQQQQQRGSSVNPMLQVSGPFMSSSVDANLISSSRPQFATILPQPTSALQTTNNIGDSLQRPSPSVINAPPQFYIRQPIFDDTSNTVSSTPRVNKEASQSSPLTNRKTIDSNPPQSTVPALLAGFQPIKANEIQGSSINNEMSSSSVSSREPMTIGNQGVSSSSDQESRDRGPTISTPSSPTECGHAETVPPPPLIPIDSLDEPQVTSPETDQPDDASDRLSIVDTNENIADSNSNAGTPKPSGVSSPLNAQQDSNSAVPSSSSRNIDSSLVSTPAVAAANTSSPLASTGQPVTASNNIPSVEATPESVQCQIDQQ